VVFTPKFKVKLLGIPVGRFVILNREDAERLGFRPHDRVEVHAHGRLAVAIVAASQKFVSPMEIGVSEELAEDLHLRDGDTVTLTLAGMPNSLSYIRKKMRGEHLTKEEIYAIIEDVVKHRLSELEIAAFLLPKTSSKAITSPSGTANTMSVLAPVEFTAEELKEIVTRVGGCIVWGGRLNIAPADDIFIEVEHPLGVDPTCAESPTETNP